MNQQIGESADFPVTPAAATRRSRWLRVFDIVAVGLIVLLALKYFVAPRIARDAVVPAPAVNLAALDGNPFSVTAQHGQMVFLDFFASWCEPCQQSMPLVEHYASQHPGVKIYAVDVAENADIARKFARQYGVRNVLLDNDEKAANAFHVTGFPTIIVVDPKGLVRARWEGFNPGIESLMGNAQASFSGAAHPPA